MDEYQINRLDFMLLTTLYSSNCKSHFNSMTITELMDEYSDENGKCRIGKKMTLYNKLQKLVKHEYISKGVMDGKADTYFIAEKGIELIEKENKNNETKG